MPHPRPPKEEALFTTRASLVDREVKTHLESTEEEKNLTASKRRGMVKLRRRMDIQYQP